MADNIEYRLMAEEDKEKIHSLYTDSFIRDEPMTKSLGIDILEDNNEWLREQVKEFGDTNMSTVAVDTTTGKIIGVVLAQVANRERNAMIAIAPESTSEKLAMIGKFFDDLQEDVDIFKVYNRENYVYFMMLSVKREYRRRGVAFRLVEEATSKGRELGYRLFVTDVTSNYSTRLFERLEYDVLVVKRYDEYKDENGDAIFRDTGEHQEAKLVAKLYS